MVRNEKYFYIFHWRFSAFEGAEQHQTSRLTENQLRKHFSRLIQLHPKNSGVKTVLLVL